jgi:SOS response regulatory protein OraA/RecX
MAKRRRRIHPVNRIATDGHWTSELDAWIMLELAYQAMGRASVLIQRRDIEREEFASFLCAHNFGRDGIVEIIERCTTENAKHQPH